MAIHEARKAEIISGSQRHEGDSGSAEVQIALLTERINELTAHMKTHEKDHSSRRGLLGLVGRRRRLLRWLKGLDPARHSALIHKLGLRH